MRKSVALITTVVGIAVVIAVCYMAMLSVDKTPVTILPGGETNDDNSTANNTFPVIIPEPISESVVVENITHDAPVVPEPPKEVNKTC